MKQLPLFLYKFIYPITFDLLSGFYGAAWNADAV